MVNVGVKTLDIGFQAVDSSKTAGVGVKNSQQDQFRKLLQGKQDESQESSDVQEVSTDTRQEKTEAPEKSAENKGKDAKEDIEEKSVSTDDSQARGLLAAYQMGQGLRPELLTAEPEVVIEMPEVVQAAPEAVDMTAAVMPEPTDVMAETGEAAVNVVPVQTEVKPQEIAQTKEPVVQTKEAEVQTKEPEVQSKEPQIQAASPKTVERVSQEPIQRETVKPQASKEENQTQFNTEQPDQTVAASIAQAPVKVMEQDVKPQEVTKIYVPQTEELPDKLTDQIIGKMEQGVQSFEIEIEPENLGKISVKILYEDGQANISIFCTEKKALDVLGNHAREIGGIIDRNLGGETKIFVEKQESDYLNQERDGNQQGKQEEQGQQKERNQKHDKETSEQFLQKLRLGLTG